MVNVPIFSRTVIMADTLEDAVRYVLVFAYQISPNVAAHLCKVYQAIIADSLGAHHAAARINVRLRLMRRVAITT